MSQVPAHNHAIKRLRGLSDIRHTRLTCKQNGLSRIVRMNTKPRHCPNCGKKIQHLEYQE